jgi:hypothetical protein
MENPKLDWRKYIGVHPAADGYPLMSSAELHELVEDIKKHGLVEPVVLYKEYLKDADGAVSANNHRTILIDGRNRLDALAMLGEKIFDKKGRVLEAISRFELDADDPWALADSLNLHRRHLTPERERIAKKLKAAPEKSNNQIAKEVKADDKTVAKVRADLESTSEIPKLEKTVGADGKARKQRKKDSAVKVRLGNEMLKSLDGLSDAAKRQIADAVGAEPKPETRESQREITVEGRRAQMAALDGDNAAPDPKPEPIEPEPYAQVSAEELLPAAFDQVISKLKELSTKHSDKFRDSSHSASDIEEVAEFLFHVAQIKSGKTA